MTQTMERVKYNYRSFLLTDLSHSGALEFVS